MHYFNLVSEIAIAAFRAAHYAGGHE